jgi:hypothetical protein
MPNVAIVYHQERSVSDVGRGFCVGFEGKKARRARLFMILLAFDSGWYYLETVGFQQLRGIV